jgi:AcrR family transcriptional regulator
MGRWEPNPRGRLAKAAFELFVAQGFDQTTGAQIAARAGMHERSFFRLFPDKRDVFFHALETAQADAVAAIAAARIGAIGAIDPIDAVAAALEQRCAIIQQHSAAALTRHDLIAANAELRERDLSKHAELATAMAEALRARGTQEPAASLASDTAMAVFRIAFDRWIADPEHQDLPTLFRDGLSQLASILAHRGTGPAQ